MLITTINNVNRPVFERLAPSDQFELLDMPGYFALGAIGEDEKGKYAAGMLIFEVAEGFNGEENLTAAELQWFYVAEEFRLQGTADALMKELLRVLSASGIEALICDLPLGDEYDVLCGYLEEWGFRFSHIDKYECTVSLRELLSNPFFQREPQKRVIPLSEFSENILIRNIWQFQDTPFIQMDLEAYLSRCDMDVSCGIWENSSIKGLVMVRKIADGSLELLAARSLNQQPADVMDLLLFAAGQAAEKYSPETMVHIKCRLATAANLIAYFLPDIKPLLVRRGILAVSGQEDEKEEV